MTNGLLLSLLVVSSLAMAAAVGRDDVILKEGHRVIVVEYDQDGKHNTKVSISSPSLHQQTDQGGYFGKETMKDAASALPNVGHGISQGKAGSGRHSPGELICDAFGKCTQRVATALGKAKDKVSDTAHEANKLKQAASGTAHEAKEKAKDKAWETAQDVREKVSESAHETRDKAADTKGAIGDALGKAKGAVVQKGQDVKEKAKESIDKAKEAATTAKDTAKTMGADIVTNTSEQVENVQEKAMEEAGRAANKVKTSANKYLDGLKYMTSMEALNTVMGIVNLLGLATAYGMSVWVTFISSYILAGQLPRQQFGVVQSKIYPVYFRAMAYSIGMALLGHLLWHRKRSISSPPEVFQAINLLSSLFMVLVNGLYLEPKATKVMFERMKMEKEDGRGRHDFVAEGSRATESPSVADPVAKNSRKGPSTAPAPAPAPAVAPTSSEQEVIKRTMGRLNVRLKKLNTNSSMLNILTLMALTWHLVYLGQRLTLNC
ncbi:hypothetical protein ES319_1Z154500v1 [Gossypium barbadense]|uniref:TMEM205-like domain-containing protein n=1 Tax=Gossypium barbadense TaxID=3634 RepID=A0A5J5ND05_GOSBA|nr:hypothetical protein ES319_1Z004100v1 [Gossypium barbadense]KAB1670591.1 hypothetical protein ES319_1Z154500v1 [Gossypium barbadense]